MLHLPYSLLRRRTVIHPSKTNQETRSTFPKPCFSQPRYALTTMLYHCQTATRGIPLALPSSLARLSGRALASSASIGLEARARPMQLPHLALQHQRYKSAPALRAIPLPSCSLIHHHQYKQQPHLEQHQQQLINSTSLHPRYNSTTTLTHTLSTHKLYTSPETNIMGVEIPTEQWAQVVEKVGGSKW